MRLYEINESMDLLRDHVDMIHIVEVADHDYNLWVFHIDSKQAQKIRTLAESYDFASSVKG